MGTYFIDVWPRSHASVPSSRGGARLLACPSTGADRRKDCVAFADPDDDAGRQILAARSLFSLLDLDGFYSVNDCGVRPPQRLYEKRQSESIAWARQRKPCSYRCNDFGRC